MLRFGPLVLLACFGLLCSTVFAAKNEPSTSQDFANVARRVDQQLQSELSLPADQLAPRISDTAFLRRAMLDLTGQLPSPSEVTLFALDPAADKRAALVERLLADERYGVNWGRYWRDVIMSRRADDRSLLVAQAAVDFLSRELNRGAGWDAIARAMVEAQGNVAERGETVLFVAQAGETADVASEISRVLLGVQISCAQCHDHPTDRWKREQFHQFAAFFPRVSLRPVLVDGRPRGLEVGSRDNSFGGGPVRPGRGSLEHFMPDLKNPQAQGTLMTPTFFATGASLPTNQTDGQRRASIAQWLTSADNPWFAKALVNRMWAELVGEGFYEPIDDLGPDRKPTAPQTIDLLAQEFVAHAFDVKWLLQTIIATDAYQREARPRRNPDQLPFTANVAQRLRADQLFDVLTVALEVNVAQLGGGSPRPGPGFPGAALFGPRGLFGQTFGYDPSVRRDDVTGSIPQALLLMNGPLVEQALSARSSQSMLGKLMGQFPHDEDAIVELYLRLLAREPSDAELKLSQEHVLAVGNRAEAFEDLAWSLVNRTEFIHRN